MDLDFAEDLSENEQQEEEQEKEEEVSEKEEAEENEEEEEEEEEEEDEEEEDDDDDEEDAKQATSKNGRFTGKVASFSAQRGFGSIVRDGDSEKIFVHWKDIETTARWPALEVGKKVEFSLSKDNKKGKGKKATKVTKVGGGKLGEAGRKKGTKLKGGPFTGKVKFYNAGKGFGFIELDEEIDGEDETEIHVTRSEIVTNDETPFLKENLKVQLQIIKTKDGKLSAQDVKLPGGKKITNPKYKKKSNKWDGAKKGGNWNKNGKRNRMGWQMHERGGRFGKRSRFGSDDEDNSTNQAEIGLCVMKHHMGPIIGKKGAVIRELSNDTGARMTFGDNDFNFKGESCRVLSIKGDTDEVTECCQKIAEIVSKASQSLDSKLVFVCPEEWCGMLVGKKGANFKKIMKAAKGFMKVNLENDATQLPGACSVNMCTIFGSKKNVSNGVVELVEVLAQIAQMIRRNQRRKMVQAFRPPGMFGSNSRRRTAGWSRA